MVSILQSLSKTIHLSIVLAILLFLGLFFAGGDFAFDQLFWSWLFRYLHVLAGVMWIGLLWYLNFVQIPSMPKIPDDQKPAIGKVIAPAVLFWFRWAALATLLTGLTLAHINGYLNDGGLADVSRPRISMERAVELISNANGVAVLAHPIYATDYEKVLDTLSNVGFVGFEVHYANFNTSLRTKLLATADRLNLLPCGGSDYHGTGTSAEHLPGSAGPPESVVNELKRLAKATSDKP